MIVSELIAQGRSHGLKSLSPDSTLLDMSRALSTHNIGILLVLDEVGNIAGVVSERDLARAVATFRGETASRRVGEIMTTKVITARPEDSVLTTLQIMTDANIRHIPIISAGKPTAMLSVRQFENAYKALLAQSRTDHLTGLANRRHFVEELEQELSRKNRFGTTLSVAMVDLDNFKLVNDTYGHDAGDDVIRAVAGLLKDECREYDEVGRLGGEEFAILFPGTSLSDAKIACERIQRAIRRTVVKTEGGAEITFSASIGLYESLVENENGRRVLKYADQLLYQAKAAGRDCVVGGDGDIASAPVMAEADAESGPIRSDGAIPAI